jgi:hypothetical protein
MKTNIERAWSGWSALALGAALFGAASGAAAAPKATAVKSTASARKKVSITVYNQNFGIVREVRSLDAGTGRVALEFGDVAAQIQPQTVHIRSLSGGDALSVLEQNYRYDLLTPEVLLDKYVGKKIKVYRWDQRRGAETPFDAEVLSVAGGRPVLKLGGEITFDFPGRMAFPELPDNLIPRPTLVWLLDSKKAKQDAEVTYVSGGLNWSADYVLVLDDKDQKADLTGWVTLVNQSGTTYEDAELKLVAGDVNRIVDTVAMQRSQAMRSADEAGQDGFREESLFEYHLYTLQRPATVRQNEQKQVTLLSAANIGVTKKLMFFGQQYWYRGQYGQVQSNQKVGVYLDLQNTEQNGLGMPIPKGTIRVYKADKSGSKQFVGEDSVDHTPRDEKIRVKLGEAFDVVGERKQIRWSALGTCVSESEWEISIRNRKDEAVEVDSWEPVGGDWEVVQESLKHRREDANTFVYTVKVPKRSEQKVRYRVRVRYC